MNKSTIKFPVIAGLITLFLVSCAGPNASSQAQSQNKTFQTPPELAHLSEATLGAGCFWCIEAIFQRLDGVEKVISGYSNGHVINPTYKQVSGGTSGHAEVARIYFDSTKVDFATILEVFWQTHDPTTLNRQGNDVGTQYRSGIYYHNAEQQRIAEISLKAAKESGAWSSPIVTEIQAIANFSAAENYHQNYYNDNPNQGYCRAIIAPKVDKFVKEFRDKLK